MSSHETSVGPSDRADGAAAARPPPLGRGTPPPPPGRRPVSGAPRGRGRLRDSVSGREREERPELGGSVQRDDEQCQGHAGIEREGAREDQAPGDAVGELPGREREQEQGDELEQSDEPEVERRAVDLEDLPPDRDGHHLRAEALRDESAPEQEVVPALECSR